MEEIERFRNEISLMEYAPSYDYTEPGILELAARLTVYNGS